MLILSALGQVDDRVKGLAGRRRRLSAQALFILRVAGARVEVLARRRGGRNEDTGSIASAISNSTGCRIACAAGRKRFRLQPREFRLLEYLMKHAGQVVTRTMLLENVWDYHFDPQTNVIDVHISGCAPKIDKGFPQPLHTDTRRGIWSRWRCAEGPR